MHMLNSTKKSQRKRLDPIGPARYYRKEKFLPRYALEQRRQLTARPDRAGDGGRPKAVPACAPAAVCGPEEHLQQGFEVMSIAAGRPMQRCRCRRRAAACPDARAVCSDPPAGVAGRWISWSRAYMPGVCRSDELSPSMSRAQPGRRHRGRPSSSSIAMSIATHYFVGI